MFCKFQIMFGEFQIMFWVWSMGTNVQIITACDLGPNGTIYANFKLIIIIIVISSMADTDDNTYS